MAHDLADLSPEIVAFLTERHLATLTTMRADGGLHVVAVGFTYDANERVARVITWATAHKALNAARGGRAAVGQVDGPRWLSLEGPVRLVTEGPGIERGVRAYAERYREPKQRRDRVVIEIAVERIMGRG
jgi:F420H(2)-dependent biliverdin reductase